MRALLKVCCIASLEEAELAIDAGATALGLVSEMPSGPGVIDDAIAKKIAAAVGDRAWTVLLSSRTTAEGLSAHVAETGVNSLQIVDDPEDGTYERLRRDHPNLRILQVIHVEDESAIEQASQTAPHVDALLLDSGKPNAAVKILGGTGESHDWSLSRKIVEAVNCPVFLAGGLKPENVRDALDAVNPAGIDLCSGIRTNGRLVPERLQALIGNMAA